jgi:hypothetical protein
MTQTATAAHWTAEQFDTFTDLVLAGVGTVDEVAAALVLFGANEVDVRGLAEAARRYV